ncbi:MAG: DNA topoisomerase III, partial [Tannerellaceae bacterium]|nr:DNA topoisomerase III [Tannerellaceae bacterium]
MTEDPASGLSEEQQIIYNMVAGRMLEAFGERCIKENTTVSLEAGGVHFVARGSITLHPGWREVFGANQEETDGEELTVLPDLTESDTLTLRDLEIQEKQTKP